MIFNLQNFIVFLVYCYLPIDTINGLILRNFDFSISAVFKLLIMISMSIFFIRKKILTPFIFGFIFFILYLIHIILGIFSSIDVEWGLKFILMIMSFYFFKFLIKDGKDTVIQTLFTISLFMLILNIVVGILGFGYAQYARDDVGTRGLFYAGNEVGILLIVTALFILMQSLIHQKINKYFINSFLLLMLAMMIGSKVPILGTMLIIILLPIIHLISTTQYFKIKKFSFIVSGISLGFLLFLFPFIIYYVLFEMNLIFRINYWIDRVDLITLFFSGRNLLAHDILTYVSNNMSYLHIIFGYGYPAIIEITGRSVEIDLIDLLMIFGIVGTILIYSFFIYQIIVACKKNSSLYLYVPYVRFGIFLLLIFSLTSGHVLNSGLAGILIGAFTSMQYYTKGKKSQNDQFITHI